MTEFRPFRGIRFNIDGISDISRVICPPYDVISPEQQQSLYDLDAHNSIRLDFAKGLPDDGERENRYTRAGCCFEEWLAEGILVREPVPAYYLFEDCFEDGEGNPLVRYGILGLKRLEEYRPGASIRPHETTFDAPKQDRLQLMKATASNFSPIFAVYQDPSCMVENLFKQGLCDGKYTEATGQDGVRRRLSILTESPE